MATKLPDYFGEVRKRQIIGDQLKIVFTYSIDGVLTDFSLYTVTGQIRDNFGAKIADMTIGVTGAGSDTITATVDPSDLPDYESTMCFDIQAVLTADANQVTTILRGVIDFLKQTTV